MGYVLFVYSVIAMTPGNTHYGWNYMGTFEGRADGYESSAINRCEAAAKAIGAKNFKCVRSK
jgi:hypothetical protein